MSIRVLIYLHTTHETLLCPVLQYGTDLSCPSIVSTHLHIIPHMRHYSVQSYNMGQICPVLALYLYSSTYHTTHETLLCPVLQYWTDLSCPSIVSTLLHTIPHMRHYSVQSYNMGQICLVLALYLLFYIPYHTWDITLSSPTIWDRSVLS
jgi:hypothetical protein